MCETCTVLLPSCVFRSLHKIRLCCERRPRSLHTITRVVHSTFAPLALHWMVEEVQTHNLAVANSLVAVAQLVCIVCFVVH